MLALNIYKEQGYVEALCIIATIPYRKHISYDKELLSQIRSSKYLQEETKYESIYRHIQCIIKAKINWCFLAHLAK